MVFALSSALGGTYNKICLIANEYTDRLKIHVIDTKITCFGEGLLAIEAAEMAAGGMSSEEILREIRWMMQHQEFIGVDGKLDYLIYNDPLAYADLILNGDPEVYLKTVTEYKPLD